MTNAVAPYMSPDELIDYVRLFYSKNLALMEKKNKDYTAGNEDAHANFRALEMISGIYGSTEVGLLTRMMDKLMRIVAFVKERKLNNESVEDSLCDLANYAAILAALFAVQKQDKLTLQNTK